MSGEKRGARTAAEEIKEEITEAETRVTGDAEDSGYGESGDALTPNTEAQAESQGERGQGGGRSGRTDRSG
ncbi:MULTISPECIES: hypothetical protein [Streptomyces]|uniref:CsbD family protein n=1 Tax=Streptomyces demainii TaxID=588122 RepID=A0ABT9KUZ4_9ACTN|nr:MULTISPECIES: hypothetical protein [Streptomyces]MDP9612252.1 hypothetical protein [Streptomyces demainii]